MGADWVACTIGYRYRSDSAENHDKVHLLPHPMFLMGIASFAWCAMYPVVRLNQYGYLRA